MYLKHYMPFQTLYSINEILVEICKARRQKHIRSHTDLLCTVILFVGWTIWVANSTSIIIRCDRCLLGVLRLRFYIVLATCLLLSLVWSSYLRPTCERHNASENATREQWCTPHKSSISFPICLGSLQQLLFSLMTLRHDCYMSSFWRYLFVDIALMTRPQTWPVGIGHCSVCYCFHCNVPTYMQPLSLAT